MKPVFFALFLVLTSCTVYQNPPLGGVGEPVAMGYGGYGGYGAGYPLLGFGGYGFGWGGGGLGIMINKSSVNNYSPTSVNNSTNINKTGATATKTATNPAATANLQRGMITAQQRAMVRSSGSFHHHR